MEPRWGIQEKQDGGVIRDHRGNWVQDFAVFTNSPSPDITSFVMFDANGLYSLRRSATVVTALDS